MAETKINDNQLLSGGGHSSSETFIQTDSYNEEYPQNNSYIDLSPNDPTVLKSNNSDFYCSFIVAMNELDHEQNIFYVEKVCGIGLDVGALKSWNWGNNTNDTVISSVNGGERYDLKCEIRNDGENTTRKWYRKISDTWTAITDAEFTDNGVDPTNTDGIRLFANAADARAPFRGIIVWDSIKIDINGQPAFDATTATKENGEGNCYTVHGLIEKTAPF